MYIVAEKQSRDPEPLSSLSVLTFQDSVELFLELAVVRHGVWKSEIRFLEYWEILEQKKGIPMTQKASMEAINRARVAFKHYGIMPSKADIESFRASTLLFLKDNTLPLFGIQFEDVSLLELVTYKRTRDSLTKARSELKKDFVQSLILSSLAFQQLIDEFESSKKDRFGRSPFFFGEPMTFLGSFNTGLAGSRVKEMKNLGQFVDKTKQSIESLSEAMKIVSLDLDFKRYTKFKLLTPIIRKNLKGEYSTHWVRNFQPTKDDAEFAIAFVIDCAVSLQNSDWVS